MGKTVLPHGARKAMASDPDQLTIKGVRGNRIVLRVPDLQRHKVLSLAA